MQTGPPTLTFRPPVHRRHDRTSHAVKKSPKSTQRRPLRTYTDIALHVLGDDSDAASQRSSVSPSNSLLFAARHTRTGDASPSTSSSLSRDYQPSTSHSTSLPSLQDSSLKHHHQQGTYRSNLDSSLCREENESESVDIDRDKDNDGGDKRGGQRGDVSRSSSRVSRKESQSSSRGSKRKKSKPEEIFPMEGEVFESSVYVPPTQEKSPQIQSKMSNQSQSDFQVGIPSSDNETHATESNEMCSSRQQRNCVTMTGTIKRGKKQDLVNVMLTPSELAALNKASSQERRQKENDSKCGCQVGLHVLVWSLIFMPFAFLASLCISFYTGSMCWYNIYIYLNEECSIAHKIFLCPLLIIFYPPLIVLASFGIAFYAMFVQISWYFSSWIREIKNPDKNFFGWVCNKCNIPQCSPYEIVIIDDQGIESTEYAEERSTE